MMDATEIQDIHELDVSTARQSIRAACEQTSADWIPRNAIAEALLREFLDHASNPTNEQQVIRNLENLLLILKQKQRSGPLQ
ncbi:MAG: hypothetical protein AAF346_10215 [Pseudomonadota bacterium]